MKRTIISGLCVVTTLVCASVSLAQGRPGAPAAAGRMQGMPGGPGPGGGGRRGPNLARLVSELNLTPDQQTKMKAIMDKARSEREALEKKTRTAVEKILTADQKKKLAAAMARPPQGGPGGMGGPGRMGGPAR